ncbi:MAG: hypothetical protein JWL58_165 [Streptosporangiaceae bacterium]|jgi:hypothetical protein|nr:hypothetical protein [Streptosporangiaceae bacterium]
MSREGIDHALRRLHEEKDRIANALLDLDTHQGYQFLKGAKLTGATVRRWIDIQTSVAWLWRLFDAYQRALASAEELRARHSRPNAEQLAELNRLLTGPSVEPAGAEIPLEKRTLLGPASERLTLDDVVARMTALYEETTDAVAATDAVWSALLSRLAEAEEDWRATEGLARSLEVSDPELDGIGRRLAEVRALVVTDPLSLARDGRADTRRIDEVRAGLAPFRRGLEEAATIRDEHGERLRRIEVSTGLVEAAEAEARQVRDLVLVKIASPVLPDVPALAPVLADRVTALGGLREQGRWPELAVALNELDRAAAEALDHARAVHGTIAGLLDRRNELRGRLEAYRAKAGRLGLVEEPEPARLYEQAQELLWTSPCDLRQATVAVAAYQRAVASPAKRAKR